MVLTERIHATGRAVHGWLVREGRAKSDQTMGQRTRWVADVRWYQIFPQLRMIPHPRCVCDTDMCLICIEPDKPGYDRRTFECPRCQHLTVEIIKPPAEPQIFRITK